MTEQLSSGIELMLAGMGIVFIFLTMLVLAIKFMSATIQRYFPDAPAVLRAKAENQDDSAVIAAISSAVHRYRSTHKAQ